MFKWLQKILFIAISFSFFISATEMDLGEAHNTFFDDYDTYVKTEQVSLDHASALQQEHDTYALICYIIDHYNALKDPSACIKYPPASHCNQQSPKLFLLNSVWRI
ncbi:MAG: hypothetical protein ABJA71_15990 [Ginsengibacter sp.]